MKDISKNVLNKIKTEKVKPRSLSYFVLRRSIIWLLFILSILIGSIAWGIIYYQLKNVDWEPCHHFKYGVVGYTLVIIPYLWLLFLACLTLVAIFYFRKTKKGYKYSTLKVVLLSTILSLCGGVLSYNIGLSSWMEMECHKNLPYYGSLACGMNYKNSHYKEKVWMSIDKGLLAGTITKTLSDEKLSLEDLDGNMWTIEIEDSFQCKWMEIKKGLEVKIIGEQTGQNIFRAEQIKPYN